MKLLSLLKSKFLYSAEHNETVKGMLAPVLKDERMLDICIRAQEGGQFVTFNRRPRNAKDTDIRPFRITDEKRVAIVVQGPVLEDSAFTLETIKLYRHNFPSCPLIVSTWKGQNRAVLEGLRQAGAVVIENDPPENPGPSNVNMQIVSSGAGMLRARQEGADYAIKTRTDQRFYSVNTIQFLLALHERYPLSSTGPQHGRIIATSMNTFMYRPYSISDMFAFGHIDDMMRYWTPKLDERAPDMMAGKEFDLKAWSEQKVAEVYLSTEFLASCGRSMAWTLEDSWKSYAENFLVIDKESIDLYWHKYARGLEHRHPKYGRERTDRELTFQDWQVLASYKDRIMDVPETALAQKFGQEI